METISEERERAELSSLAEEMLAVMAGMTEKNGTLRLSEVGGEMRLSQPTVARTVQTLAMWQYVVPHRFGVVELTEKGREWGGYFRRREEVAKRFFDTLAGEENGNDTARLIRCLGRRTVDAMERYLTEEAETPAEVTAEPKEPTPSGEP